MLTDERMETVLISATPEPTGHERLVMAFRDGDDLYIPLDSHRPANQDLLDAAQLYIREPDNQDHYGIYVVEDHQEIDARDRRRLEQYARRPISVTTEVLHVSGTHVALGKLHNEPPGFVVVIDGSERALRALAPAQALADWYGRTCTVIEVTAGDDDLDTDMAVTLQLEGTGLEASDVVTVAKRDLDVALFEWMRQGQVVVASAFGVWSLDGRLHGMLNSLVRHNAPAIIGIGPNVPSDWAPDSSGPIVICVDASEHAHHLVEKLDAFLCPSRGRVVVAHFETESPANTTIAQEVADEINQRFGIPAQARSAPEESAAAGISILAAREQSQLVITHSWHRPVKGKPSPSSTSLSSVAHAPCPVVILGE